MEYGSVEYDKVFAHAQRNKRVEYLPVMIGMGTIGVIGIIGNIMAAIFYGRKSKTTSTTLLITVLAVVDCVVCLLIYIAIAELFINMDFRNVWLCKVQYLVDHWLIMLSGFILWVISIDRFRKVSRPCGTQLSVKATYKCIVFLAAVSFVISLHTLKTYNIVQMNLTLSDVNSTILTGSYCTNSDEPALVPYVLAAHIFDVIIATGILATFIYTYTVIWKTLREHKKTLAATRNLNRIPAYVNVVLPPRILEKDILQAYSKITHTSDVTATESFQSPHLPKSKRQPRAKKKCSNAKYKTNSFDRYITIMVLAVSVCFVTCFTPYFAVSVGIRALATTTADEMDVILQLALSSPFVNSIINPFIFCLFNPRFRRSLVCAVMPTCCKQ